MRALVIALLFCFFSLASHAGPLPPAVRGEIDALLARLQASACEFHRNGSWHPPAEARTHLLRKLDYLERRNLVQSTEQFIERAASSSSASGKPYLVRCGSAAPVPSSAWMSAQLQAIRSAMPPQASPAQ